MANVGDTVRIHYTGKYEDGTVFDSSEGKDPLEFVAGSQQIIPGLDNAILEMSEGDQQTVTVPPEEAYGEREPALAQEVEREQLPEGVSEGAALEAEVGGQKTMLWVTELNDETAVVDANHPLAGKTLVFDVELVSVTPQG